jgi:hypothetical protein
MKKLTVFLSIAVSVIMFFAIAVNVYAEPPTQGSVFVSSNDCEYQFDAYDVNDKCFCMWSGIENEFCSCCSSSID